MCGNELFGKGGLSHSLGNQQIFLSGLFVTETK